MAPTLPEVNNLIAQWKKVFYINYAGCLQLIGGLLVTVMFPFFHFGTNTSKTNPNNQPQERIAEANVQSVHPQQQIPDVNS